MTRKAALQIADELDTLFRESSMPGKNLKSLAIFHARLNALQWRVHCNLKTEPLRDWASTYFSDSRWTKLGADQITTLMEQSLAALRKRIASAADGCFDDDATVAQES